MNMDETLRKEIRFLKIYAASLTILLTAVVIFGFTWSSEKMKLDEIDVARINIVEKDGTVKMVISNKDRAPDAIIGGKSYPRQGGNSPGIVFFNDKGDECGGLVFSGDDRADNNAAGSALLFDQLNNDQTVGIMYSESEGRRSAGLHVWDRSDTHIAKLIEKLDGIKAMKDGPEKTDAMKRARESGEFGAQRVFVGKDSNKTASVALFDGKGRPRIKMSVDATGAGRLEFLDESGKVSYSLPEASKAR
jgi:hypothetical protein